MNKKHSEMVTHQASGKVYGYISVGEADIYFGQKTKSGNPFEIVVTTWMATRCQNPKYHTIRISDVA
jgi:hypothetical protein